MLVQLPLFDLPAEAKAVGADNTSVADRSLPPLRLVSRPSDEPDAQE
jgi:hypothetical protein